jgi:hypothetical protein
MAPKHLTSASTTAKCIRRTWLDSLHYVSLACVAGVISNQHGEFILPSDIKKAAIALVCSCISTLIAVYFDGLVFEEISFSDPFTLGVNVIWALIIAWIIWDLLKGKDIKLTLMLVGAVMLGSLVWDYIEFGFAVSQVFYAVELLMFTLAYFLVNSKNSIAWYSSKSL